MRGHLDDRKDGMRLLWGFGMVRVSGGVWCEECYEGGIQICVAPKGGLL